MAALVVRTSVMRARPHRSPRSNISPSCRPVNGAPAPTECRYACRASSCTAVAASTVAAPFAAALGLVPLRVVVIRRSLPRCRSRRVGRGRAAGHRPRRRCGRRRGGRRGRGCRGRRGSTWCGSRRRDVGEPDPDGFGVRLDPDVADALEGVGDLLTAGASVVAAGAEHHVGLVGLVQPERDPGREQPPHRHHFLAGVLAGADHDDTDGAALGQQQVQRGLDPLLGLPVHHIGGQ